MLLVFVTDVNVLLVFEHIHVMLLLLIGLFFILVTVGTLKWCNVVAANNGSMKVSQYFSEDCFG